MRSGAIQFIFAGVNGSEYNLVNLSPNAGSGGLTTDTFIGGRVIREDKIEGRPSPYFFRVEENPMEFTVKFGFLGDIAITDTDMQDIETWLIRDEFYPLVFSDNPDKNYWVIFTGTPRFVHNGLNNGYFELNARALYPYPVTAEIQTPTYDVVTDGNVDLDNIGRKSVIPDINITIDSSGNNVINIKNNNNNSIIEITGDYDDVITIDGVNRIVTNVTQGIQIKPSVRWMEIDAGINDIFITGDCSINFRYRSGLYS